MSDEPIIDHTKTKDKVGWWWLHRSGPLSFKGDVPPKCEGETFFQTRLYSEEYLKLRHDYLTEVLKDKDLTVAPWKVLVSELDFISIRLRIPSSDNRKHNNMITNSDPPITFTMDTCEGDKTSLWDIVLQGAVIGTVEVPEAHTEIEIKRKLIFCGYDQKIALFPYPFEG